MYGRALYVRIVLALVAGFLISALMFRQAGLPEPAAPTVLAPGEEVPGAVVIRVEPGPAITPVALEPLPIVVNVTAAPKAKRVRIPEASVRYRVLVERAVVAEFGLRAPVDIVAAQLHQESAWNPDAQSPYAVGLAQFTPATVTWLPDVCPHLGQFDPWDASQAIQAAACYDAWLFKRNAGATLCDRYAFMLSDYNGGGKWRMRDQKLAAAAGNDPDVWFGSVDAARSRAPAAHKENRDYVHRILRVLAPAYADAGWPQSVACD